MLIYMKGYSTAEVAGVIGVHKNTLKRWLRERAIPEPKRNRVAGVRYRVWSNRDVERARRYKAARYRKGRGRKKKKE